jgi:hypothetical protein
MSRIGKMPIPVPSGVDVTIDGSHVTVKGPKGTLEHDAPETITIAREGDELIVTPEVEILGGPGGEAFGQRRGHDHGAVHAIIALPRLIGYFGQLLSPPSQHGPPGRPGPGGPTGPTVLSRRTGAGCGR